MQKNIIEYHNYQPEHAWFSRFYSQKTEKKTLLLVKGIKIYWYAGVILAFIVAGALITCAINRDAWLFWKIWFSASLFGIMFIFLNEALWGLKIIDQTMQALSVGEVKFEQSVKEVYYKTVKNNRDVRWIVLLIATGILGLIMSLSEISDFLGRELD